MRLLLDSHAVVWAVDNPSRLGKTATFELSDAENELLLSAATIWEVAIKFGLGKLSLSRPFEDWMSNAIDDLGMTILPITIAYAAAQSTLPYHHRDPFDRMLIAQALVENLPIVSSDPIFDHYAISRLW